METATLENLRLSSRLPLELGVTLFSEGGLPQQARMTNVSFGGAFLKTGNVLPFIDTKITLGLSMNDDTDERFIMSCIVVRNTDDGIGLMFDKYDTDTIRCLRRLYHQYKH